MSRSKIARCVFVTTALVGAGVLAFLFLKEIGDGTAANSSRSRVTT